MVPINMKDPKTWKTFNQLFKALQSETNKNKIEKYHDKVDDWKFNRHELDNEIIKKLVSILNDEIKRKKEQLRNKPGRQPATDWFRSLGSHVDRINDEIDVLQILTTPDDKPDHDLQATITLIMQSLRFSTQLIAVDQEQIEKRQAAREIQVDQQQKELLKFSKESLNAAISLLK